MSGARRLALALGLSLALHGAGVVWLRWLGVGGPSTPPAANVLAPLIVDLVEPLVALPDRGLENHSPRETVGRDERLAVGVDGGGGPGPGEPTTALGVGGTPAPAAPSALAPIELSGIPPPHPAARPTSETSARTTVTATQEQAASAPGLPETIARLAPRGSSPVPEPPPRVGAVDRAAGGEPHGLGEGRADGGGAGHPTERAFSPSGAEGTPAQGSGAPAHGPVEVAAIPSGRGTVIPPEYDSYVRALRQRIQERLVYPWLAVRRGLHGVVELEVQVDSEGRLAGVGIIGGDGGEMLRQAAARAVRDATPLPFPVGVAGRPMTIRLPVVFELR